MDTFVDEVAAIVKRLMVSPSADDRALAAELAQMLEAREHSWYHDGTESNTKDGYNRVCQRCGFREQPLAGSPCTGNRTLRDSMFETGRRQGLRDERDRMRTLLGL